MPYISKQEVKKLVENLERFGLFKVTTDKGTEFMATEIIDNMGDFLEFRRLFATSKYSDNAIIDIEYISETMMICKTPTTTYTIEALYGKKEPIDRGRRKYYPAYQQTYIPQRFAYWLQNNHVPNQRYQHKHGFDHHAAGLGNKQFCTFA